jgi:hypothetical protein
MQGIASDSFIASVGTGGKFTGIAATEDNVLFFKEDRVFILSGTEPPFQLREKWGPAIPDGAAKSVVCQNGAIFFQGMTGFMRMDVWNYPTVISQKIGSAEREPFVGGTDGERILWASDQRLLIYDQTTGAWMKEDAPKEYPLTFLNNNGRPLLLSAFASGDMGEAIMATYFHPGPEAELIEHLYKPADITVAGVEETFGWEAVPEGDFDWHCTTGLRGLSDPEPKRLNSVKIRLKTGANAAFRLYVQLDEDGEWKLIQDEERTKAGTYIVRYAPNRRCDLYRLKIEGHGDCVIYSITESYENAGDGSVGL